MRRMPLLASGSSPNVMPAIRLARQRASGLARPLMVFSMTARRGVGPDTPIPPHTKGLTDVVWREELFRTYIRDPHGVTPGTNMVFTRLKDDTQIENIIAHLKQFGPDGARKP
jgi:hypothetical protein